MESNYNLVIAKGQFFEIDSDKIHAILKNVGKKLDINNYIVAINNADELTAYTKVSNSEIVDDFKNWLENYFNFTVCFLRTKVSNSEIVDDFKNWLEN